MSERPLIILTGGGTAGHVMGNLALKSYLQADFNLAYIASKGLEKDLVMKDQILFYTISSGKFRRYWSWRNLTDLFFIGLGFLQSIALLFYLRPRLVFSKGGYVTVPVVYAAWVLKIPVISHESDFTCGLATRLNARVSRRLLTTFKETSLKSYTVDAVGLPIRESISHGDQKKALKITGFEQHDDRVVILVTGGSQGAESINQLIYKLIHSNGTLFFTHFRLIHLTGRNKLNEDIRHHCDQLYPHSYYAQDFATDDLPHFLSLANLVISRAGANTIFELLFLKKPMLLVPLKVGSRGDQIDNAESFRKAGWARVLSEESLTVEGVMEAVMVLKKDAREIKKRQQEAELGHSAAVIAGILKEEVGRFELSRS